MRDAHDDERRDRDRSVVIEDVVDDVLKTENAGRHDVVAAQGRRHDGGRGGDHASGRQGRHLRRAQDRVERRHQDDGEGRGARDDDREKRTHPEDERHEDVGRTDAFERAAHDADHGVVGADVRHVGGKTEEGQNDEPRVRVLLDEDVLDRLEGIDPGETRGKLVAQNRHAENERAVHQNDAGGEEHHFGVVVFGNGPSRQDERHETNRRSEHVEDLKRGRKGKRDCNEVLPLRRTFLSQKEDNCLSVKIVYSFIFP